MDEPNLSYEDEVFENSFEDNVGLDDMLLDDPNHQGFPHLENKENEVFSCSLSYYYGQYDMF